MKISIIPASTQAGKATIEALLKQDNPPEIRAIYRNTGKVPAEFIAHPRFEAVRGGLDDGMHLDFVDSDAVFYIPPPIYDDAIDSGEHAMRSANKVKTALGKAVKLQRLIVFSALGSQYSEGIGILKINHITDHILADSAPEVIIARPGWFNENWAEALDTAKGDDPFFETHFTPADHKIVMISIQDISKFISQWLLETGTPLPSRPQVYALHGPRNYSMLDLQDALEQVNGKKPRIDAVEQEKLLDFFKAKLPPIKAQEVTEMTMAINGGGLLAKEMEQPTENVVRGETELIETLRQLAGGEISKAASGAF